MTKVMAINDNSRANEEVDSSKRKLKYHLTFVALVDLLTNISLAVVFNLILPSFYTNDLYLVFVVRIIGCIHALLTSVTSSSQDIVTIAFLYLGTRFFRKIYDNPTFDNANAGHWIYLFFNLAISLAESMLIKSFEGPNDIFSIKSKERTDPVNDGKKPLLLGLEGLRFFASIHIVIYHFNANEGSFLWRQMLSWAGSQLTYFFVLSGFILSYQYCDRCGELCNSSFWMKRFVRLFPSLQLSIIGMCLLIPVSLITPKVMVEVIFSTTAWDPSVFENHINTPAWTIGALLFLYLIFPNACRILTSSMDLPTLGLLAFWFWCITLLGAATQMGYEFGTPFTFFHYLTFKAHFAEFLFGVTLGYVFTICLSNGVRYPIVLKHGAWLGITLLLTLYFTIDLRGNWFAYTWMANGMVAPILAMIIWSTAAGEDMVLSGILGSNLMKYFGQISFQIYIQQSLAYQLCVKYDIVDFNIPVLITFASAVYYYAELPLGQLTWQLWKMLERALSPLYVGLLNYIKFCENGTTAEIGANYIEESSKTSSSNLTELSQSVRGEAVEPQNKYFQIPMPVKLVAYYVLMVTVIGAYAVAIVLHLQGTTTFIELHKSSIGGKIYKYFQWAVLIGAPATIFTLCGQGFWCPWNRGDDAICRRKVPTIEELTDQFDNKLYFRIVTRGMHPLLVREHALLALKTLDINLPRNKYFLEVVTDNPVGVQEFIEEAYCDRSDFDISYNFSEIVVEKDFTCSTGAKYKARALQYAILNSTAKREDWIVHLDEETRFDAETIRYVLNHCALEDNLVASGKKVYGNIGQGVILYGAHLQIENYFTTLADSIRVGDDFGKFRLQYQSHYPWIGMHGSFVVSQNAVEMDISFNHGIAGSITEDAYFALVAWEKGVQFSWVDAFMYEQSPFTIKDFILQRRRWFGGLWLVCRDSKLPLKLRITLLLMILTWALSTFAVIVTAANSLVTTGEGITNTSIAISLMSATTCWSYILGFLRTFSISDGFVRYFILLYLQLVLQPFYAIAEIAGVLGAIFRPPVGGFHIVQKEGKKFKK